MANVNLISVRLVDDAGAVGNVVVPVPAAATLAQMQAYVNTMLPNLDTVTGAKIDRAGVSVSLNLPGGLKAAAIADHPIQWGINFSFDAADTPYAYTIRVPALDQGLVTDGNLDISPAFVQNWIGDIVTGDGTVAPTDRYGNDLTALLAAADTFRKS